MSNITHSDSFKHYALYSGTKNEKGFYIPILQKIDLIFDDALVHFSIPMVAHFIVDDPIDYRVNQSISRIISTEAKKRRIEAPKFYYISVIERRRKNSHFHQHLMVVLDKGDYYFFTEIRSQLRRFSRTATVRFARRKDDSRPEYIDQETGEVKKDGSIYYHNLRRETFDAFQRLSYIAKVETKLSPKFSSSRLTNCNKN